MKSFKPSRVKFLRLKRGLTQQSLAESIGLSASGVAQVEKGKRQPLASTIAALAEALKTTPNYFFAE